MSDRLNNFESSLRIETDETDETEINDNNNYNTNTSIKQNKSKDNFVKLQDFNLKITELSNKI